MTSHEVLVETTQLETEHFKDYVQHTTYESNPILGLRRVKVVKRWWRRDWLGGGNFGQVYLEESDDGELRAVKVIQKGNQKDFRRELEAMVVLSRHSELFVQFLGWFETQFHIVIAMEYVQNGDLDSYLRVRISEDDARVITWQILEGLDVLHSHGYVHRDLKPANIVVVSTSPLWVKISDFGSSKLKTDATLLDTQCFSVGYAAPEVMGIDNGNTSEYTHKVDIWSLGCIVHKLLTGELPFRDWGSITAYCDGGSFPRRQLDANGVSRLAIRFVMSLFRSQKNRLTAKEALGHPWLKMKDSDGRSPGGEPVSEGTLTSDEDGMFEAIPDEELDEGVGNIPVPTELPTTAPAARKTTGMTGAYPSLTTMTLSLTRPKSKEAGVTEPLVSKAETPMIPARPAGKGNETEAKSVDTILHHLVGGGRDSETATDGKTALHLAIKFRCPRTKQGAEIQDINSCPPLLAAIATGNLPITEKLLKCKPITVVMLNKTSTTLLHFAAIFGHQSIGAKILELSALEVDALDASRRTPLHVAVGRGKTEFAIELISSGANIEAKDFMGQTPLRYVVHSTAPVKMAKLLLRCGASPDAADNAGSTPRMRVARSGHQELIGAFLRPT